MGIDSKACTPRDSVLLQSSVPLYHYNPPRDSWGIRCLNIATDSGTRITIFSPCQLGRATVAQALAA